MIGAVLAGAGGRVGNALITAIEEDEGVRLVGALERPDHPAVGTTLGGVPVVSSLERVEASWDVIIDFSDPEATLRLLEEAASLERAAVTGTTGLTPEAVSRLEGAARTAPLVVSPNMSIGVNLLFGIVEEVARSLGVDYDAEIVETHHRHKVDAPSGTALKLAETIATARATRLDAVRCDGRTGTVGPRPKGEIGIHAVRGGDIVGRHEVTFAGPGECLGLRHEVFSRATFARGALLAAKWVVGRPPGIYSMTDVLGLR